MALGYFIHHRIIKKKVKVAREEASSIIESAEKEAESMRKEALFQAKDELYRMRTELENEFKERRVELHSMEKRLMQKEENLDHKMSVLDRREDELTKVDQSLIQRTREIEDKKKEMDILLKHQTAELERIAGISSEEAKQMLMKSIENEARYEASKMIKRIEDEARATSDKKSKEIIATAIQRYSADYVAERTVSVVTLPNEEMKGRIIGREGRNIRAIEAATGIDLIIDDTPEAVVISSFDPIRREVARIALERLITDGRIHPARIEEIVEKVNQEMGQAIIEAGEQAAFDAGVHGIHHEIIKLLGRLKFRTSYAQNVFQHSMEVSFICGIMAAELGINAKQAKRAGLLHDIGKAVDHEVEGAHAAIGADIARRYGEPSVVVNAIGNHHLVDGNSNMLAVLVSAADSLSAARPGARREMLETYIKRLEDLEHIASSFNGVNKSYAIQAGREIRIMVEHDKISDEQAAVLCSVISRKIESDLSYPGQIKVVTIREMRAVDYAK
ncbi:MAG: ribonuclease Y [Deltaproteobacteria bacterium]|nr:ribonuclease Y [Deltaproteobacteria bacterium]MBW2307121.1 ribonuclease Y [Deltaproteobacteria bacterium]